MRAGDPKKFWENKVEHWLRTYQLKISPVNWFGNLFNGREGFYVVIRLVLLLAILKWTFSCSEYFVIGTIVFIIDIILANTSIVFVTRQPAKEFRSVILTFVSYVSLGIGFAAIYALIPNQFCPILNPTRSLYFSFATMTTLGFGDVQPKADCWQAQMFVVIQLIISLYFLAVLITAVVSWGSSTSRMPQKT